MRPYAGMVNAPRAVRAALVLTGFTAAAAQIVLMRELMVAFRGNDISIGLALGTWLFWTAVGSGASGRLAPRAASPLGLVAALQALLALAIPATVLAVRAARAAIEPVPGESFGPGSMVLISAGTLCVFCALSGALFPAASLLCRGGREASAAGVAYLWEAIGAAAGGLAAALVLIRYLSPIEIAWGLGLASALAACGMAALAGGRFRWLVAAAPLLLLGCALSGTLARWDAASVRGMWPGSRLVATRNSVYGSLAVVDSGGARSAYENGVRLFTVPDPEAAEEAVDYALLEAPAPRSVLLIGGGFNGSAAEALRHPGVERLDYVELDPALLDMARDFFPRQWAPLRADPRVHLHAMDGRLFVKTAGRSWDAIVVNLPDPQTAQLNRFFTAGFFAEAAGRLTDAGVLSFALAGSENYIPENLAELLRCMNRTARSVFPEVVAMPGETIHFFAARRRGVLAAGTDELLARLRARHLPARYAREYYIRFRLAPDRTGELEAQMRPLAATPVNRDSRPVAYYFDVALWSSQFHQGYRRAFAVLAKAGLGEVAGLAGALALLAAAGCGLLPGRERRRRASAGFCTVAMGFSTIGLEILLLLGFQAAYGYVYTGMALLIAAFMAGVAAGSWLGLRSAGSSVGFRLAGVQAATALACIAACAPPGNAAWFPAMALVAGALGGFAFPLVARVFSSGAGTLYALDLAGSCLGAALFSTYLIPVFGFIGTGLLMALVCLAAGLTAVLSFPEERPLLSFLRRPER